MAESEYKYTEREKGGSKPLGATLPIRTYNRIVYIASTTYRQKRGVIVLAIDDLYKKLIESGEMKPMEDEV